ISTYSPTPTVVLLSLIPSRPPRVSLAMRRALPRPGPRTCSALRLALGQGKYDELSHPSTRGEPPPRAHVRAISGRLAGDDRPRGQRDGSSRGGRQRVGDPRQRRLARGEGPRPRC